MEEICFEPEILFNSNKFTKLSAPLLEIILKRDDLNSNEIEIWRNLVRWGLAQEPALNQDVSRWNDNDIITFKRIFHEFIPLIKFYEISSIDYFDHVNPFGKMVFRFQYWFYYN